MKNRLVAPLLRVPVFAGLRPLQIAEIAHHAERVKFEAGQTITAAGAPGDGAYLIVSGAAECVASACADVGEPVVPGSLVGEMAMLVEHDYRETVVARDRVLALKVTRQALHAQMLDDPALARHFEAHLHKRLARVAQDLRAIDDILLEACGSNTSQPDMQKEPTAAAN